MNRLEESEQIALIEWAALMESRYPELCLLAHVPNGGKRSKAEAGRFKAMGVRAGFPDLILPVARCGFNGLAIEMKAGKGKTSDHQQRWLDNLEAQGWKAVVCRGWVEAKDVIEAYMKGHRDYHLA